MGDNGVNIIHVYNTTKKPVVFAVAESADALNAFDTTSIGAMSVGVYFVDGNIHVKILDTAGSWVEMG